LDLSPVMLLALVLILFAVVRRGAV
jgi:hypothetical protein